MESGDSTPISPRFTSRADTLHFLERQLAGDRNDLLGGHSPRLDVGTPGFDDEVGIILFSGDSGDSTPIILSPPDLVK